jgi:hypothetical protein
MYCSGDAIFILPPLVGILVLSASRRAQEWDIWKVGNLQPTDIPGVAEAGWEFNITTEHGRPLLTLVYKTKAEGSAAAAHVLSAVRKAALVRSHG